MTNVSVRIGLTSYREPATWGAWNAQVDLLPSRYADEVRRAGGLPLILPAGAIDADAEARAAIAAIDGLVLTGGSDVDPARYGAEAHVTTDAPRVERDEWELALTRAALAADRPVLAVCRGLQILNVALGGDLIQHLPDTVGHEAHRPQLGHFGGHHIVFDQDALIGQIYAGAVDVPTHHHQAVGTLGDGLVPTAWSDDGTVEAVTCPGRAWVHGVQWHPEVADGEALFAAFVQAAATEAATVSPGGASCSAEPV